MNVFQLDLHILAQFEVEGGQRLVEQQHFRTGYHGTRNGYALLLPTRQSADFPSLKAFEVDQFHRLGHPAFDFFLRRFLHSQTEGDVFIHI